MYSLRTDHFVKGLIHKFVKISCSKVPSQLRHGLMPWPDTCPVLYLANERVWCSFGVLQFSRFGLVAVKTFFSQPRTSLFRPSVRILDLGLRFPGTEYHKCLWQWRGRRQRNFSHLSTMRATICGKVWTREEGVLFHPVIVDTHSLRYKRHFYKRQIRRLVENAEKFRDISL